MKKLKLKPERFIKKNTEKGYQLFRNFILFTNQKSGSILKNEEFNLH